MIQANELRIGNYVDVDGNNHIVTSVNIDYTISVFVFENGAKELFNHENKHINPIPLTEERLIKFGFEKNGRYAWKNNGFQVQYYTDGYLRHYRELGIRALRTEIKIEYIHQLQNLYFALTGKELKLVNQ